jgi:hypothetical protein
LEFMRRLLWLRRISALLFAVCFLAGPLEALIPDVHHDGSDAETAVFRDASIRDKAAVESCAPQITCSAPNEGVPFPSSNHPVHADHCSHSHVATLTLPLVLNGTCLAAESPSAQPVANHTSVAIPPLLRPPLG